MADKIEILLVEDDKDMRDAFAFCIEKNPHFHLAGQTGKQAEAIEIVKSDMIGVVILDLELEEGDGIHFMEEMKMLPIAQPLLIVITNNRSVATLEYMRSAGADFICQKNNESYSPMTVLSIVERTYPFHCKKKNMNMEVITFQQNKETEYRKKRIEEELVNLGFKITSKGAIYLVDAIYYVAFETKSVNDTIKTIYEVVAQKQYTKSANVEKSIRDSIERVWNKTDEKILERYYPYEISKDSGCPTNKEFVFNMAKRFDRV